MDPTNPRDSQVPNSEWVVTTAMELGADQDLKPQQKCQEGPVFPKSLCKNMMLVHERTQPTQEMIKMSNWVWANTSTMKLEVNQDLKPSRKFQD